MNIFARIKYAFAIATAVITNRYESGQRWSADRSYVPGFVQDARFDADQATRQEIVRKSRYFERNSGIVNRLVDLFEQYTVGPNGLRFVPASSDTEWNKAAAESWGMWERFCDLTSLHTFGTLQSLCARLWFVDGEAFIVKTYGREVTRDGRSVRRPRLQLIEGHRVETPGNLYGNPRVVEGVEVNEDGRPIAYHIRLGIDGDKFTRVMARDVVHIFEPSRAGQLRGLPMLYPVLNDLNDLDDLQALQMRKSKDAADITNVFKTGTGELPANGLEAQRFTINRQTNANVETLETRTDYIRKASGGGRTIAIRSDETLDQHRSDTPSIADQQHWDYVLSKICAGVGISKLLVFPSSMQGTVVRADLDTAAAFFRSRSAVLSAACERIYQWVMEESTLTDVALADPPSDWRRVSVRPPRSVNVDVGRNSQAVISELSAGIRTFEQVCGEMGTDWMDALENKAREAAFIKALSVKYNIDPSQISTALVDRPDRIQTEKPMSATPPASEQPTQEPVPA